MMAVIAAPVLAAAAPPDIKEVEKATEIFTRCTKVADEIAAVKGPEGHAAARMMRASHHHKEAKGELPKIEAKQDAFTTDMEGKVAKLDECGKEYEVAIKAADERLEKLRDEKIAEADGNAISQPIKDYYAAKDKLVDSIAGLSKDIQVQSYVHHTLREHFIKEHRKGHHKDHKEG
jgi:hypothetical protein